MSNSSTLAVPLLSEAINSSEVYVGPQARLQRSNRSAGKGRRRRAVAEQRRAEQEHWTHLVHNSEEEIYVAPPAPPVSRRQLRRAARRSPHGGDWDDGFANAEDDDNLDVALALSLSLLETPHNAQELMVNHSALHNQHLDMSYENLVMLENVKCTAPAALVSSLTGHIYIMGDGISTPLNSDELCTICQNDFKDGDSCIVLPCLHTFHDLCGSEWFLKHSKLCPVCKHDVTEQV